MKHGPGEDACDWGMEATCDWGMERRVGGSQVREWRCAGMRVCFK